MLEIYESFSMRKLNFELGRIPKFVIPIDKFNLYKNHEGLKEETPLRLLMKDIFAYS